ncbi:sensor histidine kinase [Thioalkalivibrio denitrificans]|uniref:Sensor histidine kinase n=1 Tax=Thioalkalivibrio denitrificans TaxID=108003 RepID=A0A1V3NJA3_9GAMM|nr:sensor histidine kinase [Thioalkalivibrio denitrificans]OOG25054.1 sensor histidine kinase [Thioalkalivibrio denitrificans]
MNRASRTTRSSSPAPAATDTPAGSFLPNFCESHTLFLVVLIAQLLAFILTLARGASPEGFWVSLAFTSLFVQWVALGTVLVLCLSRRRLAALPPLRAALATALIVISITGVFALTALWISGTLPFPSMRPSGTQLEFLGRTLGISAIVTAIALRYLYVQHQWKSNVEAEARSRIQALQARIRPHFLFNSMNTIAALTRTRPEAAETAVEDLADLFRATLSDRDSLTVGEELDLARRYVRIEALRLGDRLRVDWQVDESLPMDYPMPGLVLQPLVENAIYHGIEPLTDGGEITIVLSGDADNIRIEVSNPLAPPRNRKRAGNRVAQENIRQRLDLAFRGEARMETIEEADRYRVTLVLPRRRD